MIGPKQAPSKLASVITAIGKINTPEEQRSLELPHVIQVLIDRLSEPGVKKELASKRGQERAGEA
jgi:hypothetical protein